MREILFRGKAKNNPSGDFLFGSIAIHDGGIVSWIEQHPADGSMLVIDLATVGQYTGLTDKNGKKIFEGDKVWWGWGDHGSLGWEHSGTVVVDMNNYDDLHMLIEQHELEVIGNIYDNPELAQVAAVCLKALEVAE